MGDGRDWQRSSFWLQYGRARRHLQACDLLLEQINTCAVPPGGRPAMDMPAGIMRKAGGSGRPSGAISAHAVPGSPLDVASELVLSNGESGPGKEVDSEVDAVHCTQVDGPSGCDELEGFSWGTDGTSGIQVAVDAWIEEGCSCGGSQSGDEDGDGQEAWRGNVVVELGQDLDNRMEAGVSRHVCGGVDLDVGRGGEGRVSRRSVGGSPESVEATKNPAAVSLISAASCYVEGPSGAEMLRDAKSMQRRSSFCRIEAFVIRSRSTRAVPGREHGSKQTPSNAQG